MQRDLMFVIKNLRGEKDVGNIIRIKLVISKDYSKTTDYKKAKKIINNIILDIIN